MRIVLDECVRKEVLGHLSQLDVKHVRDIGWASMQNGELIARAADEFDILVTVDKSMPYQHSIKGLHLAVIVLDVPDVEVSTYVRFLPELLQAIANAKLGEFHVVRDPKQTKP